MYMASDWQVETLRITVFPSDISAVSMSKLWDSVVGQDPDAIHFQRDVIDAREIRYGNGRLVLAKHTDRFDWHYLSIQDNNDSGQLPIIGKLEEELNAFSNVANACLDSPHLLPISRLAFGAVLLHPVNTVEDGNLFLEGKLSNMNLEGVREFNYQVNRRRMSKIDPGIEVNRLSKWNVYSGQLVTVAIDPLRGQQVSTTSGLRIASRLELDINTFPERTGPLPKHEISAIFRELINLGLEISERGDVS
jgi:hypothetical protein